MNLLFSFKFINRNGILLAQNDMNVRYIRIRELKVNPARISNVNEFLPSSKRNFLDPSYTSQSSPKQRLVVL